MTTKPTSEAQKRTIEKMKETRYKDYQNLRDKIEKKLIWIADEQKKGLELLNNLKLQIEDISKTILRLRGAQAVLKDILKNPEDAEHEHKV